MVFTTCIIYSVFLLCPAHDVIIFILFIEVYLDGFFLLFTDVSIEKNTTKI